MRRARMRAVAALGAAGAAATLAGGAAAQDPAPTPSPTPQPPAQAGVTLEVSRDAIVLRGRRGPAVTLRGALSSTAPVGRVRVRLAGRSAAYRRDTVVRTARTDAAGRFRFRIRPQVNASYRVTVAAGQDLEGRSRRRTVLVFPRLSLTNAARGRGLRLRMTASAPARLTFERGTRRVRPGSAERAFFYVRLQGERRFRRVGAARLSGLACDEACRRSASVVVRRRSLLKRTEDVGACVRGTAFRGLGEAIPCGAARRRF